MTQNNDNIVNFMDKSSEKQAELFVDQLERVKTLYLVIIMSKIELATGRPPTLLSVTACLDKSNDEMLADDKFLEEYAPESAADNSSMQLIVMNRVIDRAIELYFGSEWKLWRRNKE
jgi:hypothetical protein